MLLLKSQNNKWFKSSALQLELTKKTESFSKYISYDGIVSFFKNT